MSRKIKTAIVIIGLVYGCFITALLATTDIPLTKIIILGIISAIGVMVLLFILESMQKKSSSDKSTTKKIDTP